MKLKVNDFNINWSDESSYFFFNKKAPERKKLKENLPFFKGHLYFFTSGEEKICIISKKAFLNSARAVNQSLKTSKKDKWLLALPLFHVGGLSILARSFVGDFKVIKSRSSWDPKSFVKKIKQEKVTLSSLTPTQVFDLVSLKLKAPSSLRAVIVGGDRLDEDLYKKARSLNWPLLPSYGLTENSSGIACAELSSLKRKSFPKMKLLSHVSLSVKRQEAFLKSSSLFKGYFDVNKKKLIKPIEKKGFLLPDKIQLKRGYVSVKGRKDEILKILSEQVSLSDLRDTLYKLAPLKRNSLYLIALPEKRLGFYLSLVSEGFHFKEIEKIRTKFNKKVLPFERISTLYFLRKIKKTSLGKVSKKSLLKQLGF